MSSVSQSSRKSCFGASVIQYFGCAGRATSHPHFFLFCALLVKFYAIKLHFYITVPPYKFGKTDLMKNSKNVTYSVVKNFFVEL